MTPPPHPRASRDHRTVLLPDTRTLDELVLLATATGWSVWSARLESTGLRLTLTRS